MTSRGRPVSSVESSRSVLLLNEDGYIEVDEEKYDGLSLHVRVKAITPFGEAVYKDVEVVKRVPEKESMTVRNTLIGVGIGIVVICMAALAYKLCFSNFDDSKRGYGHQQMSQDSGR